VTIRLTGSVANPLVPSPTIDYQIDVSIDFSDPLNLRYTVVGDHDGFPNYELYLNEQHIHGYAHDTETPLSLVWPMEKHFQREGTVQQ
jgi:hypothetical protein